MMKIGQLILVLSITCVSQAWATKLEIGSPLPGRVKVTAVSEGTIKRIQISGSLLPLRIFINGLERTQELSLGACSGEPGVSFNLLPIQVQGHAGIFYWEGNQIDEELTLQINTPKTCGQLKSRIPLTLFEKPFLQETFLHENEKPSRWKVTLRGEKITGVDLKIDQGELKAEGDLWIFHLDLVEGKNLVTGVVVEKEKQTPLDLKFNLTFEHSSPDAAGLLLDEVVSEDGQDVRFQGKVNKGSSLSINDEVVVVSDEGAFEVKYPLEVGKNNYIFVTESKTSKNATVKRSFVGKAKIDLPWALLPGIPYVGLSLFSLNAHYSSYSQDLRVNDDRPNNLTWTKPWGKDLVPLEIYFRFQSDEEVFTQKVQPSTNLQKRYGLGVIRLHPWKKALHFGYGLGYHQLQKVSKSYTNGFGGPTESRKDLRDLRIIGRIGWTKTFGNHWAWMASWSPFVAIGIGESWEKYGFDLIPVTVTYSY